LRLHFVSLAGANETLAAQRGHALKVSKHIAERLAQIWFGNLRRALGNSFESEPRMPIFWLFVYKHTQG
jgi:hypothetical protein